MLEFKELSIGQISELRPYYRYALSRACDYTAGATFMWRDYSRIEHALFSGALFLKAMVGPETVFSFPLSPDPKKALGDLAEYGKAAGVPLAFCLVTETETRVLEEFFGQVSIDQKTDFGDYLYRTEDFRTFVGKRYNGQRNHMNFFKRTYPDYAFEEFNAQNLPETRDFYIRLSAEHAKDSPLFVAEREKVIEILENYEVYGMLGGLLRAGQSIVGFSMGEVYKDTLYTHVEKADTAYRGAYQVLLNEFTKRFGANTEFVNREEDVGDEGLRISKLSYHPCEILKKYIVRI